MLVEQGSAGTGSAVVRDQSVHVGGPRVSSPQKLSMWQISSICSSYRSRCQANPEPCDPKPKNAVLATASLAVNLLMQWESGGQSCLKLDLFSGDGVVEFQKLSVQKISSISRETGEIFNRLAR